MPPVFMTLKYRWPINDDLDLLVIFLGDISVALHSVIGNDKPFQAK